jgi:hypothetical protein
MDLRKRSTKQRAATKFCEDYDSASSSSSSEDEKHPRKKTKVAVNAVPQTK